MYWCLGLVSFRRGSRYTVSKFLAQAGTIIFPSLPFTSWPSDLKLKAIELHKMNRIAFLLNGFLFVTSSQDPGIHVNKVSIAFVIQYG